MFRLALPVIILAQTAQADICKNVPNSPDNCVRALACIGEEGLFFDGEVRGWNQGTLTGTLNTGVGCRGTWEAGTLFGSGQAQVACNDGTSFGVIYTVQDNVTGTAIGRGIDNLGRPVQGWSGEHALDFLTAPDTNGPALPCIPGDIPIS